MVSKTEYSKHPKKCKHCNRDLPWENRRGSFCNHKCASIYNNTNRITSRSHKCKGCGVYIPCNRTWCSIGCQTITTARIKMTNGTIGKVGIRKYLLRTRDHKCARCGNTMWENRPITLEAHHKDGNHNNNEETNLDLLCPNCHSITNNYKAKNKGMGRDNRRVRSGNGTAPVL